MEETSVEVQSVRISEAIHTRREVRYSGRFSGRFKLTIKAGERLFLDQILLERE